VSGKTVSRSYVFTGNRLVLEHTAQDRRLDMHRTLHRLECGSSASACTANRSTRDSTCNRFPFRRARLMHGLVSICSLLQRTQMKCVPCQLFREKLPKSTPTKPVRHVFPRLKTGVISAVAETLRSRGLQWSPTRSPVHTWHLLGTKISGCTTRHEACRSRRHDHAPVAIAPSTVRL